jgi:hypothetical protein
MENTLFWCFCLMGLPSSDDRQTACPPRAGPKLCPTSSMSKSAPAFMNPEDSLLC